MFLNQPLKLEMSSERLSKSLTAGFLSVASAIPVKTPTPIAGLRTATGAVIAATSQFRGCAFDRMLKSTVDAALVPAQMRKYLRLSWKPLAIPTQTIIATRAIGTSQPMIFPALDGFGTFEISVRSVESSPFSRRSIVFMIPLA